MLYHDISLHISIGFSRGYTKGRNDYCEGLENANLSLTQMYDTGQRDWGAFSTRNACSLRVVFVDSACKVGVITRVSKLLIIRRWIFTHRRAVK